jgi:thiamine-phosphate pyrophosphorylase
MTHPLLARGGLYAVTDGPRDDLPDIVAAVLAGGASLLQYRDKTADDARRGAEARALQALCARSGVPLLINDDVALAAAVGAAGVHLGEDDAGIAAARAMLGPQAIIGVSCYDDIGRARALAAAGADYLAFGAFFASPSKPGARHATPGLLRQAAALVAAGADYLAVISAVFGDADPRAAAQRFAALLPASRTQTR